MTEVKKWVTWPYKKDYRSGDAEVHWSHLEKPDPGNPDYNIKPNHQIILRLSKEQLEKIKDIAIECNASKGIAGLRERVDADGKATGEYLLTCKTSQHVSAGNERFPETYKDNALTTEAVSRGDVVSVLASPGLITSQKKIAFYLKRVDVIKKGTPPAKMADAADAPF